MTNEATGGLEPSTDSGTGSTDNATQIDRGSDGDARFTADKTVWVRSNRGNKLSVYHTDRECTAIESAKRIIQQDRNDLPDDLRECRHCAEELSSTNPTRAYQEALRSGGGTECGRPSCEAPPAVTYESARGRTRTRCDAHALVDTVKDIGEARAEAILDEMPLADVIEACEGADGSHVPVALIEADRLGPITAARIAERINRGPVAGAIREEDN